MESASRTGRTSPGITNPDRMSTLQSLDIAISPCPNDTFIFGAWVLGLTLLPKYDCRFFWHDVQELNEGAMADSWSVTKVSAATALRLQDTHAILPCGGAFGLEHGPKVVIQRGSNKAVRTIAVPGLDTTAMLMLKAAMPQGFTPVPMIFHAIVEAVQSGAVDAGLLIHETALIYEHYGLDLYLDLGQWWQEYTQHLPLPLGCIIMPKASGKILQDRVATTIRSSIQQARVHPEKIMPLVAGLARELDAITLEQHINAYVNDLSLDMGDKGRKALKMLQTFWNHS